MLSMRGPLFSIIAFFVFEGLLFAALKVLPTYMHMDTLRELPLIGIAAMIFIVPVIVTVAVFRNRSNADKAKIAFTMIGVAWLLGTTGNFISQQTRNMSEMVLIFNWVEGVVMLLGGIVCGILAYLKRPQTEVTGEGTANASLDTGATRKIANAGDEGKAEAKTETPKSQTETEERASAVPPITTASRGLKVPLGTGNKMPAMTGQDLKQKNAMSNSASNLRGLLDTLAPDDDEPAPKKAEAKPAEVKPAAANAAEIAAKADAIAKKALEASAAANAARADEKSTEKDARKSSVSATGLPEQRRPTASSTATRLQAQKRKSTSTFIKLQALSSSGTGSTRPKTADTAGSESSESLKSILDRLDSSDDEDVDFFGSDSLLEKPDMADKPGRVSKTSMPAATPPSSSAVPAQPTRPLSSKPAPGTGTSNTQMPAQTPGSGITAPTSPAAAASAAKPVSPQAKQSMKGSDTSIPSLANKFVTPAAAKAADSSAQAIPAVPATPAAQASSVVTPEVKASAAAVDGSAQPSLTDMLNSIKTPGAEPIPVKPERPAGLGGGGLGSSTLGRVAGKKTGIQLGGTSSTNLSRIESVPELTVEPTIEIKPIPAEEPAQAVVEAPEVSVEQFDSAPEELAPLAEAYLEPVLESVAEPIVEVAPEPIVEPVVEAVVEPVVEPVLETIVEPVAESIVETVVEPVTEPVAETFVAAPVEPLEAPDEQLLVEPVPELREEPISEVAIAPAEELSSEDYAESVSAAISAGSIKKAPAQPFSAEPHTKAEESFTPESTESSASSDFTSFKPSFDAPTFESYESTSDAMMNFAADREEPAEQAASTLFESAAVDQEIEDIFSNLVPPEAQQEVNEATLSHTRLPALDALQAQSLLAPKDEVEAPKKEARKAPEPEKAQPAEVKATPAVTPPAVPSAKAEPSEKAESNTLFEVDAVDREIEDIFSNLVPPEAQQEVNESTLSHNRLQAMDRSEAKALLRRGDEEKAVAKVSEMNKPAAAVETVKPAPVEVKKTESVKESPAAEIKDGLEDKKEGLFDPSLDQEIDDIFFNLAPEEAQAEVNNETLKKVKAPDAALGEMSFAPPAESGSAAESTASSQPVVEAKAKTEESFAPPAGATKEPSEPAGTTADKVADLLGSLSDASATTEASASASEVELAKAEAALQEVTSFVADHAEAEAAAAAATTGSEPSVANAVPTAEIPVTTDSASVGVESDVAITPVANKAKEVKEFGRLSVKSATAGAVNETVGTMKTIGKLLIDVPAIENIIKSGESGTIGKNLATARVISSQRGASINALLEKIDEFPGIAGTLIVGHDGLVISSTLKAGKDKDTIGALSVACLGSTNLGTRKLEIGKLKQMVFITDSTITVLTDVEVGILAVLLDSLEIDKIDGVLQTIHDTIHG